MNYLNTGNSSIEFKQTIDNPNYVDKSMLINGISHNIRIRDNKYICITRPRRFGKTINANMLAAYYTKGYDSHELFDDLKVAKTENYEKHMNKYNVIYIDFSILPDPCDSYQQYISWIKSALINDLQVMYYIDHIDNAPISHTLIQTNDSFIFVLDEWDSIFYKDFMSEKDKMNYLQFLKGLLKDQAYVDLVYMTGVLPIAKYSSGSELNMFDEFNFMNDNIYDQYFGFTEEEVKKLCQIHSKPTYEELQYWYNGYYLSNGNHLFNPRSVNKALMRGICQNYWTETGPMNEIADCIEHNVDEVREDIVNLVAGNAIEVQLDGYSVTQLQLDTRDEILSAMVVFGFLSYYDGYLTIPNYELMQKYNRVLSRESMGGVKKIVDQSKAMLEATINQDEEKVAEILESVHDQEIPFLNYNDENSLSCVITLCYLYARNDYDITREDRSGKGYVDYLFIPKKKHKPAIVLELKYNKSVKEALEQIKKKNYIDKVKDYQEILLVGINYDGKKHHECMIEKMTK
ncbi:AAA family ATPase [Candidatus Stoquefichus massiliensis]|uniref:AAA family ATPase n=1 Tax=Candidatus Stoquefichus massiliensis TaxID=1470350 RepID=UPI000677BEA8|nr:AAA family ATPase [Candidatus Stoquefichus massiliensis]